jgi:hypothetical protein
MGELLLIGKDNQCGENENSPIRRAVLAERALHAVLLLHLGFVTTRRTLTHSLRSLKHKGETGSLFRRAIK